MDSGRCLVIFTKPAVPGRVKTRLIGGLTGRQAADLHRAFLDDLSSRFAGAEHEIWLAWALEGEETPPPAAFPGLRQEDGDLGHRQLKALAWAAGRQPLVAVIGSDHPTLARERVDQAFEALESGADLVFGPARDGGYYLLALRRERLQPELFSDVAWSSDQVLDQMLSNSRRLGLTPQLLAEERDIDTPADLEWLREMLSEAPSLCPATRSLLAGWGMMRAEVVP